MEAMILVLDRPRAPAAIHLAVVRKAPRAAALAHRPAHAVAAAHVGPLGKLTPAPGAPTRGAHLCLPSRRQRPRVVAHVGATGQAKPHLEHNPLSSLLGACDTTPI